MPLDLWIARTDSFDSVLSPSPAGPIPHEEVIEAVAALHTEDNPTEHWWVLADEGSPLATLEAVAVGESDVLRIGVSMPGDGFERRCRDAWELAANLAEGLGATAFEATAGRIVAGSAPDRFVAARSREAGRSMERLAQNGLAPLEFPVENLDAVANVLTLASPKRLDLSEANWRHGHSQRGCTARWRWEETPFEAALQDLQEMVAAPAPNALTLDARMLDDGAVHALSERRDHYYASFYLWWRGMREEFTHV